MGPLTSARPVAFVLVRDRTAAEPFYRDTLGLVQTGKDAFATAFDLYGVTLRLTTVENHSPGGHTVIGWEVRDIAEAMATLRSRGVTFEIYEGFGQDLDGVWTAPDARVKIAWFNDPEGNNLSLTQHS